jgi:hypothetical protein
MIAVRPTRQNAHGAELAQLILKGTKSQPTQAYQLANIALFLGCGEE